MAIDYVILTRHARSTYNESETLNGDPRVDVELSPTGLRQVAELAHDLREVPITHGVCTRFPRTRRTLEGALGGRTVPITVIPEFDDVALGVFEGRPVTEFRAWRHEHGLEAVPPGGGESRVQCLRRYAVGYEVLLGIDSPVILAVVHDITLRMLVNAINADDPISGPVQHIPNATPYRFTPAQIRDGLEAMHRRADAAGPPLHPPAPV